MTIVRASVFLASLAAAAPAAADVPGGTGTTERLALGANAGGELGPGPDSDWFRLTLEAGRLHAFTVSTFAAGGNIGFRLAARDAAGRVLAADDLPTRGDSEVLQINFRPRVAGTYFLEVTFPSFWTPGPASTLPYEVGLRRDASSSFGDAARLPFGRLVPGTMESTTDRDYHVVRLPQGEPVDVLSPGIATWDTVALFDRDRRLLGTVNDRFGKLAHHVPAYTGDHYILVSLPFASRYTLKVAPADRGRPTPGGDLLVGTDKPDALDANGGDDEVRGLAGADVLRGGAGDDTILGGAGDDTLRGSRGADQLSGDAGEDALTGGRDPDDLRGGPGRDTFLFYGDAARGHDSGSRSNPDPYQRGLDRIHDFAPGDRIDLRGVDADAARPGRQPFSFVGAAPFSGSAQVRHGFEPDTDSADRTMTVVAVSTDADPAPEMEILLRGRHALRAADFVLRDLPRRR